MFLAFDIGNTNIKTGLFHDDDLIEIKYFNELSELKNYVRQKEVEQAAISSVVPQQTEKVSKILSDTINVTPFLIDKSSKFNLKISYESFETLGIDRVCSAEGAFAIFKSSNDFENYNERTFILSIDFGTATTINIVQYPGEFIGGMIAPGIGLMFDSLKSNTAQLPEGNAEGYESLIGKDTVSSIASGVINSSIGLIERALNYLKSELKADDIKIFITGGNAERLLPFLKFKYQYERGLVLIGINQISKRNII